MPLPPSIGERRIDAEILQIQANTIKTLGEIKVLQHDPGTSLSDIIEAVTKGDLSLLIKE